MTLEQIIKEIDSLHCLEDAIYYVRDRIFDEDEEYKGNSWHHPKVKRYGELIGKLKERGII